MIKLIHTADWHLGKILHKQSLHEEMQLFSEWLITLIKDQGIDLLLVSGDIFDLANPANKDVKFYYDFLIKISKTGVKTIITGGNHDSISLLNAPSSLLQELNISVVGGVPDDFDQQIIPIYNKSNHVEAVVLAVPFLRDHDLRQSVSADKALDRSEVIPAAIRSHYERLFVSAKNKFGNVPIIAMGHLYMQGAQISDSEREIHVGNLMGMDRGIFPKEITYAALGHIHKPQRIDKLDHIRYSGSPVYLDFSEAGYEKIVVQVNVDATKIEISPIKIPTFRHLLRVKGSLPEVGQILDHYTNEWPLKTWVEVEVLVDHFDISVAQALDDVETKNQHKLSLIKTKISSANAQKDGKTMTYSDDLMTLSPIQIFNIRLSSENLSEEIRDELLIAYTEILEDVKNDL